MANSLKPMHSSRISGFYKQTVAERQASLAQFLGQSIDNVRQLGDGAGFGIEIADVLVENAVGVFGLPLGIACNFRVNGRDRLVPMVIEESSVIAAASNAARLLRNEEQGIVAEASAPVMIGQLQVMDIPDIERGSQRILADKERLIELANRTRPTLLARGGGARDLVVRVLHSKDHGSMIVVHLHVDVCDAMGANIINTMMEALAPEVEELSSGRVYLKILSNLTDLRTVRVRGAVPVARLSRPEMDGVEVAQRIERASVFAEVDPYRAATHNKGIMNGIDAVLLATGQDFRAVEAGAHAYAARSGQYSSLSRWRYRDGALHGEMELPLAVGIVGGITRVHPIVQRLMEWMGIREAAELAEMTAAVGLAQNLAAILALSTEGIQRGHMSLHARNIAIQAGASTAHVDEVAERMRRDNRVSEGYAREIVAEIETREIAFRRAASL
ncbi:MAG: hydroxymethylglutaryl-CoA reductase, degradative [Myxococcales bacterium]|nr:hydroxymethylglutaryl-CoA reductase, degradative [Myxococcales bacterium]